MHSTLSMVSMAFFMAILSVINGDTTMYKFFRRDYVLDTELYPEIFPTPRIGGKIHIVFTADKANGSSTYPNYTKPYTVSFGGNESFVIDTNTKLPSYLNWMYCDYEPLTGQVWLSAHLSNDYLLATYSEIAVTDSNGNTMGKTTDDKLRHSGLELLYVAIDERSEQARIVMHFYNYYDDVPFNIGQIYLNGMLVNDKQVDVGALQHTVVTSNITDPNIVAANGAFYTVGVVLVDSLSHGFGGRYVNPRQKWTILGVPVDSQCPFPSTDSSNYNLLVDDLYVNSLYLTPNDTCGSDTKTIMSDYNDNWDDFDFNTLSLSTALSDSDNEETLLSFDYLTDFMSFMTVYNGLNANDGIVDPDDFLAVTHFVWQEALQRRLAYPSSLQAVTCMSNHQIGSFTGITDIQIVSFNYAGCQPNVLNGTYNLSAVYAYFENARLNQMPDPTYAMIEGFEKYFDSEPYGLTASEINIGIGSALAAGVQGIVFNKVDVEFQTDSAWDSVSTLLKNVNYLIEQGYLRISAPHATPIKTTDSDNYLSLWSSLRTVDEIIIIAVNLDCSGYNREDCSKGKNVHWECQERVVSQVDITLPLDFDENVNVKEIVDGAEKNIDFTMKVVNETIRWTDVKLDDTDTTRIFLMTK